MFIIFYNIINYNLSMFLVKRNNVSRISDEEPFPLPVGPDTIIKYGFLFNILII